MKDITKQSMKDNLIQTVGIILFISIMTHLFGEQEALTSVAGITAILMFKFLPLPTSFYKGLLYSSVGFFVSGSIASLNLMTDSLCLVLINSVTIFSLILLFGTPFSYKFYIPFILAYIFSSTTEAASFNIETRLLSLGVISLCIGLMYGISHKGSSNLTTPVLHPYTIQQDLLKASIVMSLGISLTLFITHKLNLPRSMWICMTIMSLTQLDSSISTDRFKKRILGSIIGTGLYLILFIILIPNNYHFIIVLLTAYMYSFISDYFIQIIFITLNALYAANSIWPIHQAIGTRFGFIIIGSIVVGLLSIISSKVLSNIFFKTKLKKPHIPS